MKDYVVFNIIGAITSAEFEKSRSFPPGAGGPLRMCRVSSVIVVTEEVAKALEAAALRFVSLESFDESDDEAE